jgi:hypothetical protein
MSIEAVRQYISSDVRSPFFLAVGDEQYNNVKNKVTELGFDTVRISDYCGASDKPPNLDDLRDRLKTADINVNDKKLMVVGLGEYLAMQGKSETESVLSSIKELPLGTAKVVLLLRGVAEQVKSLNIKPGLKKLTTFVTNDHNCNVSIAFAAPTIGLLGLNGIEDLLIKLENGRCGNIKVNTMVDLSKSMFTVHRVKDAYDGVCFAAKGFGLSRNYGTAEQWIQLLKELNQYGDSLDSVFRQYGFADELESDFYARIVGAEYRNWLYFIALQTNAGTLSNGYLRFVLEKTSVFEDFKMNVLTAISDVPHTDKRFSEFYVERKILAEKFPESDIAYFVVKNRKDTVESIYKLTNGTKTEREEIVAWVSQNRWIPQIADIYPEFAAYMKKYLFNCEDLPELSQLLSDYFESYKRQKVSNALEEDFLEQVDVLAKSHKYKQLPTRNSIIEKVMGQADIADVCLFWLDALGVEYLAYISELARNRGLSLSVHVAQTELPSITTINNGFYYIDWRGRKDKIGTLDDTKHKPEKGYNFENNELPIHLAKELDIIAEVISRAATELAFHNFTKILIVSDHGASRLAVLRRKEEKYETDEDSKIKGEHSGRCCKEFEPYDLPFAISENGYLVLADYGRFKGSRASNVEVHGGASLEEVVIPIIELTLKNAGIKVELVEKSIPVDRNNGIAITLFSETPLKQVSLIVKDKRYSATVEDANHYRVVVPDIKRVDKNPIPAEVYAGDDLIGAVQIATQSKIGESDFDKLFEL